jgi:hypothetical protein
MTRPARPRKRPADENRRRRLSIIAELDRMLTEHSLDPEFKGNVEVLIPAKDGRIGEPQFSVRRHGRAPG